MLLPEADSDVFKRWVLPKLETISDADAEVLADYVVALVTTQDTDANIRRNCLDSLSDFLQDNTATFVDEVILALKNKSYAPRPGASVAAEAPAPIPSIVGNSTAEYLPHPAHALSAAPANAPKGPAASRASNGAHRVGGALAQEQGPRSRKRKQNDRDTSQSREGLDPHSNRHTGNDRPVKQTARRGGKGGRGGGLNAQAPAFAPMPNLPPYNPAFGEVPPFDPGNPMAFLAMAAAFGINLPGMPSLSDFNAQGGGSSNIRCADYDTKGFCAAGSACPYQHGLEYDSSANGGYSEHRPTQGRGYGGRSRAPFSLPGPTYDRTNTTIVVEQIPEDNFSEQDVRDFFGKFGTILDVRMQAYKRLAVVKYETHEAANAAYQSPKVIFDNRFVKVYWHRSDADLNYRSYGGPEADEQESYGDAEVLSPEEIERRQAEAQRAFEERRKKEEEAAARAEEIDRKLQETNAEILRVRREIAKASADANGQGEEDFTQDLATLQAEAENLFAQQDAAAESWSNHGRGTDRGGYRGRGYAARARGFRGGYRGRGGPYNSTRTGVKRLDNRPRSIAIKAIPPGSSKDEALKQHLFTIPDILTTTPHPHHPDTLILTFAERYQAESFIDSAHQIPDVGKLDMEWVPNDMVVGARERSGGASDAGSGGEGEGEEKHEAEGEGEEGTGGAREDVDAHVEADVDMDVAEDEDRWL